MKYRYDLYNKEWFIKDPRLKKWIVRCNSCGQYGRKPDTPMNVPKVKFEENFPIIILNENGICSVCMNVLERVERKEHQNM